MTSDRIKEIQQATAYPESRSVKLALLRVWDECAQENAKLVEALEKQIEYGEKQCEIFSNEVERIKKDSTLLENAKVMGFRLAQGKFYGWRDSTKFLRESLQNTKNIEG